MINFYGKKADLAPEALVHRYVLKEKGLLWESYGGLALVVAVWGRVLQVERQSLLYEARLQDGRGGYSHRGQDGDHPVPMQLRSVGAACDTLEEGIELANRAHLTGLAYTAWIRSQNALLREMEGVDIGPAPRVPL